MKVARQQARVLWTHGAQASQGLPAGAGAGGGPSSRPPKRHFLLSELQHLDFEGGYRGWRGHRCRTVELPGKVIALLLLPEGMGGSKSCLPRVFNPHPRGRIILSSICTTSFQFLLLQSLLIADLAPRSLQDVLPLQRGHKVHGQLTAPSHPRPRPHAHPSLCAQRPHQYTLHGGQRYIFSVWGPGWGRILRQGLPFGPGVPESRGRAAASPRLSV